MTIHQYIEEHGMPVQGIKGKLLYAEDWEGLMNEFMESTFNAARETINNEPYYMPEDFRYQSFSEFINYKPIKK